MRAESDSIPTPRPAWLIYDEECAYCRRFAGIARRLDRAGRLRLLPYQTPGAQALLRAQFGEEGGFTMYLFEPAEDTVSWARTAAGRLIELLGLPRPLSGLAFRVYPALVRAVSHLARRRRRVCPPGSGGCGPSSDSDSGPGPGRAALTPQARAWLKSLDPS